MSAKIISTTTSQAMSHVRHMDGSAIASAPAVARISFVASAASLVALAALHVLSPEFDPSKRMVSEYALGSFSWVLSSMFLAWALSCVALFVAIKSQVRTTGGRIGLGLLLLSALGMAMAAIFDVNHNLHGVAALIGMPNLPIAAVFISVSLGRNPSWNVSRRLLIGTAILTWVSLILMNIAIFTGFSQTGEANPGAWFGWANRFLILAYNVWLMTAAWRMVKSK
ncbi:MAG TPA: DUF998 domain-containing protein [Anaerolineales bacterium]|nr:DUF998 domain-containing protein [Anaerolineales bacterium]